MKHRTRRHPSPPAPGFTLVEVLLAMGILVLGFSVAAGILATGALSLRRGQEEVEGKIGAQNALELLKGQGLNRCDMEFPWSHTDTPRSFLQEVLSAGFASGKTTVPGGIVDDEICGMMAYNHSATSPNVPAFFLRSLPWKVSAPDSWTSMFNISNNGMFFPVDSDGKCGGGTPVWLADGADMTDFTRGRIRGLHQRASNSTRLFRGDFSYPLYVSDPELRGIHVSMSVSDANYNASASNFLVVSMAGCKRDGDSWPEMSAWIDTPWARCANMWDRRMIATGVNDSTTCGGLYDGDGPGWSSPNRGNVGSTYYWYGARNQSFSPAPATRPGAYRLAATMFDQANSEITIAYPDGANFPASGYSAGNGTAVSWADPSRRIGIGDTIVSGDTGDIFHVQAVRDHPKADRVNGNAMLQILTVYPPLKSTALRPSTVDPFAAGYYMTSILFMPRPNAGGDSPLVGVQTLNANDAMRFDRFN